jgi:hypothetical protein
VPSEWRGLNNLKKIILEFSKWGGGGVTPQGGRTTWGKGKEREVINEGKGEEVS